MSEEIKIQVTAAADARALTDVERKIEALKAKMAELNAAESNYASKGLPEAAASVRSERLPVARELRDVQRQQRQEERAHTQELRAQTQELHAQQTLRVRLGRGALMLGQEVASGGSIMPGAAALGAGGAAGTTAGVAAIIAAIMTKIASVSIGQENQSSALQERLYSERKKDEREQGVNQSWRETAGGVQAKKFAVQEEIHQREDARAGLERQATQGGLGQAVGTSLGMGEFLKKGVSVHGFEYKPEGARAIEENEAEIARLKEKAVGLDSDQRNKADHEEVGIQLRLAEAKAQHSIAGAKLAREEGLRLEYIKQFRSLHEAGIEDPDVLEKGADTAVREKEWDMRRQAASGLVNARSGAADIARASDIARGGFPDTGRVEKILSEMHSVSRAGFGGLLDSNSRKDFSPGPLP